MKLREGILSDTEATIARIQQIMLDADRRADAAADGAGLSSRRRTRGSSAEYGRGLGVEGIGADGQGKKVGIIVLQVAHVGQPLEHQQVKSPAQVLGQVLQVGRGQPGEIFPVDQFIGQVEDRPQKVGELVVLQQVGIAQQGQQEGPARGQENL